MIKLTNFQGLKNNKFQKFLNKKNFVFLSIAILVVVIALASVWFFVGREAPIEPPIIEEPIIEESPLEVLDRLTPPRKELTEEEIKKELELLDKLTPPRKELTEEEIKKELELLDRLTP